MIIEFIKFDCHTFHMPSPLVYIFHNSKSNIIKLGFSNNVSKRLKSFQDICGYWKFKKGYITGEAKKLEQESLKNLSEYRIKTPARGSSEFCKCSLDQALNAVEEAITSLQISDKVRIIDEEDYYQVNDKSDEKLDNINEGWLPSKGQIYPHQELKWYKGNGIIRQSSLANEYDYLNKKLIKKTDD